MPSVSALFIDDAVVGPRLELLRRICQPSSSSRPHITVRYFDRVGRVRDKHLKTPVHVVDILAPGAFGLEPRSPTGHYVVYLRCGSGDLEPLEHKPHFPSSEFHITVYEGPDRDLAQQVLRTLLEFSWGFRVPLPNGTTLTEIPLGARRPHASRDSVMSEKAMRTLRDLTNGALEPANLVALSFDKRVELVRAVCLELHRLTADYERAEHLESSAEPGATPQVVGQSGPMQVRRAAQGTSELGHPMVHLTPPELAVDMAKFAVDMLGQRDSVIHFGDPAVGNGVFFQALRQVVPESRIESAIGVDLNPEMVAAARRKWGRRGLQVLPGDFLHMDTMSPRNLILANPPYLRHQDIEPSYKAALRGRASTEVELTVSGRSGLYIYFMLLSHQWMSAGAVAAWLVPADFMQSDYGDVLRRYLTSRVDLLRVHQFDSHDPQFENARVMPCVLVFRNHPASGSRKVVFGHGGTLVTPARIERVAVSTLRSLSIWVSPFRTPRKSSEVCTTVSQLFSLKRGIATGANDFFIMSRERARELRLPSLALRPILPKSRFLSSTTVGRRPDGYPDLPQQHCLLDCDLDATTLAAEYPDLWNYLLDGESRGLLGRNLVAARHPWYKQEVRAPAPFLCTYMGRGSENKSPINFILNRSDAVATNAYLMMYPSERVMEALAVRPERYECLRQILQEALDSSLTTMTRVYAEDLRKIEPGRLRELQLRGLPQWLSDCVPPESDAQLRIC